MQFACDQETFATWLKRAALFADSKSPVPVYGYIKLDAAPGELGISAASSAFLFRAEIPLPDLMAKPGNICVQADRIADLVAALRPNCPVQITHDNTLEMRSGRTIATLNWLPADQFPVFDNIFRQPQITTTTAELDRVIGRCLPPMGDNPDRAMLWGMSLQYIDRTVSAASCNDRFCAVGILTHQTLNEFPACIIPRPVCLKLRALLKGSTGNVDITINPNAVRIATTEWTIIAKLVNAIYPPHAQLLAPMVDTPVTLTSAEMLAILARIAAGTDFDNTKLKQRGAVASFNNNTLTLRDGHHVVLDSMPASCGDTVPEEIGFNIVHMMQAIEQIDVAEIELHFTDRDSRIRVCAAGDTEESFTTTPYRVN